MIARLTNDDLSEVFDWLKNHKITFDACRIHRDFSDCVKVAKVLQKIYPRLVEMNNYPKRNNTALKIYNWETLNHKVLSKIGLQLNAKRIAKLANCKAGAIEHLLWRIMLKEIEIKRNREKKLSEQDKIWAENDDVVITTIKRLIDGEVVQTTEKLILYSIYEDLRQNSRLLSKQIAAVEQKIEHLAQLNALKAEHLVELTERLKKIKDIEAIDEEIIGLHDIGTLSETCVPSLDLKDIHSNAESQPCSDTLRKKKGSLSY